ncbi:MAG: tetratricopeptide repeat protein [Candidatus Riflebacteria bacterium]|nr:tetratricopeptide repeat protein [Candidatus Riflebacteria bacterium]
MSLPNERSSVAGPPWYFETWAILVLGLLCLPVGIFLLTIKPGVRPAARALFLSVVAVLLGCAALVEIATGVGSAGLARYRAFVLRQRAGFFDRRGETAVAARLAVEAFSLYPKDTDSALDASAYAARLGDRNLAGSLLQGLMTSGRDDEEARMALISFYLGEPATWTRGVELLESSLETRQIPATHPQTLCLQAQVELRKGDLNSATYHLREVVRQFRRDFYDRVYRELAAIERVRGDRRREVAFLCESLRMDPADRKTVAALESALAALRLNPFPYRAFVRAVHLHQRLEARAEAAALFRRILERAPGLIAADGCHYALATHHFYYEKDFRRALDHYRAIIERHSSGENYFRSLYQAGQSLEKLSDDEEAARYYRRLLDESPRGTALAGMASIQLIRMKRLGRVGRGLGELNQGPPG